MKKLLLIALLALTFSAGAQVTYIGEGEGSFTCNSYSTLSADRYVTYTYGGVTIASYVSSGHGYNLTDGWNMYNPDLTLYKSFHGLPVEDGENGNRLYHFAMYLGKHAVNDDDKYEFLVTKEEKAVVPHSHVTITWHFYIYNEDGAVLYTFPDVFSCTHDFMDNNAGKELYDWSVHLMDGELRLAISYVDYDLLSYRTKFYKFDGRPDMEDIVEVPEAGVRSMPAFPNPTRGEVTLPYTLPQGERATMQIFDMSGRLIEQRPISGEGRMVKVDVSAYAPGVYLYEYKGQTNRFVVR